MLDFILDNRTIFFTAILISGGMVLYLLMFSFTYKWSKASVTLITGNFFEFLFFAMGYYNALAPGYRFSLYVGIFDVLAVTFWVISLNYTLELKIEWKKLISLNTVALLLMVVFFFIFPNVHFRRGTTITIIAILLIYGTYNIQRKYNDGIFKSFYFTGLSMVAFSIFKIGMAIYRFMNPVVGATIFEPNTSIAVSAFGSLMFMILINISFVYMDHDFLQSKILKMSTIDPLTKIHNRRYFMEQFECILCKSRKMHALAIIDLDDFKRVNDTYGHVMGDEVLYEFSTFLKDRIRHGDILARYGGEEFILLLEINNEDEVRLFMDRIIKDLKDIKLSKEKIPMTFSGGVILLDEMEKDMKKIIAVADERLYHAKETGKKRIVYA